MEHKQDPAKPVALWVVFLSYLALPVIGIVFIKIFDAFSDKPFLPLNSWKDIQNLPMLVLFLPFGFFGVFGYAAYFAVLITAFAFRRPRQYQTLLVVMVLLALFSLHTCSRMSFPD